MRIVGSGFLAGNLEATLANLHPDATVIAAGVSSTSVTDADAFEREGVLVRRALESCAVDGHRVVFFSTASSALYGSAGSRGGEDDVTPTSPYGRHKLRLEETVRSAAVPSLILRASHLVGSNQRAHHLLPSLLRQIAGGRVHVHHGAYRDLLDVAHLVAVVDMLLERVVGPQRPDVVLNVCTGVPQPIDLVLDRIEAIVGRNAERTIVPRAPDHTVVSPQRLLRLLPEVERFGFTHGYLDRLLARYVPVVASDMGMVPSARAPGPGSLPGRTGP